MAFPGTRSLAGPSVCHFVEFLFTCGQRKRKKDVRYRTRDGEGHALMCFVDFLKRSDG